jgi:signal transduction histidine kinase
VVAWLIALLAALLTPTVSKAAPAVPDTSITLREADVRLLPQGQAPRQAHVILEHRWDRAFPGLDGRATYLLTLPAVNVGTEPMGLMFSRLGNQSVVKVNGVVVLALGNLGDPLYDAAKCCHLVTIPASLLRSDQPNELVIDSTVQRQRGGGLSPVLYGRLTDLAPRYAQQYRLRRTSSLVYAVSLSLMGGLAAGLWWRQRDALYGCFSLAAFCGVARNLDQAWPDVPIPWPWWGALVAVCYTVHMALIVRFVLLVLNRNPTWLVRSIHGSTLIVMALACLSFALHSPWLWSMGLALLVPVALASLYVTVQVAQQERRAIAWILATLGALALFSGVHDLVLVRLGWFSGSRYTLVPHAMFFFVLALGALVVERYSRLVANYHALNATLAERVAQREQQLGKAFEALRAQQEQQAVLTERQRMMREIHDGVGSQLVGLLNMVNQRGADPQALESHVREALDEMRMAVDSLQPMDGDLTAVLATLRYRLQPRLTAAGIEIVWDVSPLPALPQLSPQAVLDVQRLLLEAFTNVLKHARATQVIVQARWRDDLSVPSVQISLVDNGIGLPQAAHDAEPAPHQGRGLLNMQTRAHAIGASLSFERQSPSGTRVMLDWPVPAMP